MEEEDIIKKTKEEKLKKLAGNFIWGSIQCFCQKNGISHFESQILPSDSGVSSYFEIENGKYLNLLFLYSSYETALLYLPVLYDCAKKIVNPLIKIRSKYINNWRAPKNEIPKENKNRKDSNSYVKERLRNLGAECEIFEYDDFFRIKISSPKKICPMEACISFDSFYEDLIFLEDFLKKVIAFEEVPVNAFIVRNIPKHHIVPSSGGGAFGDGCRKILDKFGVGVNDPHNCCQKSGKKFTMLHQGSTIESRGERIMQNLYQDLSMCSSKDQVFEVLEDYRSTRLQNTHW